MKRLLFTLIMSICSVGVVMPKGITESYLADCCRFLNDPVFVNYSSNDLMDYYVLYVLLDGDTSKFEQFGDLEMYRPQKIVQKFITPFFDQNEELVCPDSIFDEWKNPWKKLNAEGANISEQIHCLERIKKQQTTFLQEHPFNVDIFAYNLETFKKNCKAFPVFFDFIKKKYKNNIQKFSRAIAQQSIFVNHSLLDFSIYDKKLLPFFEDPGVIYAIGSRHYVKTIELIVKERIKTENLMAYSSDYITKSFPFFSGLYAGLYYGKEHVDELMGWGPAFDKKIRKILDFDEMLDYIVEKELTGYLDNYLFDMAEEKLTILSELQPNGRLHPAFKKLIEEKYQGSVNNYVDALFKESIMTSSKQLKKFIKKPTSHQLKNDIGIQYAVRILYYETSKWE